MRLKEITINVTPDEIDIDYETDGPLPSGLRRMYDARFDELVRDMIQDLALLRT